MDSLEDFDKTKSLRWKHYFETILIFSCTGAPLNGITLGPRRTDSINRMIPLTDTHVALPNPIRPWIPYKIDPINQMIPLTMIPLSGLHCNWHFNR
jgi:hypothetical protein